MLVLRVPPHAPALGLLLWVAGCAGSSDDADDSSPTPPSADDAASRPERPPPRSLEPPSDTPPEPVVAPSEEELREALRTRYIEAARSVDDVLGRHCGSCHGKSVPSAPCGLRFDNVDDLYVLGLLAPLSSDDSRIVQVILDGSMPPAEVQPRPDAADVDPLRAFIDEPAFWSGLRPGGRSFKPAFADAERNACPEPQ